MKSIEVIANPLRRLSLRSLFLGLAGGVALSAGAAFAQSAGMGMHHGHAMGTQDMAAHVGQVLQSVYAEVGATDAQKAQLDPLVKQAVTDVHSIFASSTGTHEQLLNLIGQDTIDPAAIETLRAAHVASLDQASKRIAQLIVDSANVLTPAQRKQLAAHIAQMHAAGHPG